MLVPTLPPTGPAGAGRSPRGLAAGHRPDDQVGLRAGGDLLGQGVVRRLVGQVLLAGEEPDERPPGPAVVPADRPAQHRVAGLQGVEHRALGDLALDLEFHLAVHPRERPQVRGKHHADHGSVWTSTESTGGRSRTMGSQVSPASAEAYTWPPVVPKYTPHSSSESTAIASRSTLT